MDRRGLTLLEMILALTIFSLAGAVVYGALRTSLDSWEAGVREGRRGQVARVALDRISQQLKSAVPAKVGRGEDLASAFDGGSDHMRFVTLLPVSGRPLAQVSYSVEEREGTRQLVYRELPWPDKEFSEGGGGHRLEEWIPEISDMKVLFRARDGGREGAAAEKREWQPGDENDMPAEVEITLVVAGSDADEETLAETVIPLRAEPFL